MLSGVRKLSQSLASQNGLLGGRTTQTSLTSFKKSLPSSSFHSSRSLLLSSKQNWIVNFVPEKEAWVIERFGGFNKVLTPGLQLLMPFIYRIAYVVSLKEETMEIINQMAITKDNVNVEIGGILFFRVVDPYKASYEIEDYSIALEQLAISTLRSEVGKMNLDTLLASRDQINQEMVEKLNQVAENWGIVCRRYELREMNPPQEVLEAMHKQSVAERTRRERLIQAEGEAAALKMVGEALQTTGGKEAVALKLAEAYLEAFNNLAKEGTTVLLPANTSDPSSIITQALTIYKSLGEKLDKIQSPMSTKQSPQKPASRNEDQEETKL